MTSTPISVCFLILFYLYFKPIPGLSQDDGNHFFYNGFSGADFHLDGEAKIHSNGLLQLTSTAKQQTGHAFYKLPLKFNKSTGHSLSFSTHFVFAMVPEIRTVGGHGMAFTISPSMDFSQAMPTQYLGLFNTSNDGLSLNHVLAIELDTAKSPDLDDINGNHVGVDLNGLKSNLSAPAAYYSDKEGKNKSLELISGDSMQVWIDYDQAEFLLNVTLAPIKSPKPSQPLLSTHINLSHVLLDSMYVGFSASTGSIASNHYLLGWSFNRSGPAQSLQLSNLPSFPQEGKAKEKRSLDIKIFLVVVFIVLIIMAAAIGYLVRRKKFEEIREDWEVEYGPQRFCFKDLYKATKGFKDKELLGSGGFGKVYKGVLPSSKAEVAVKKIAHDSRQGMKEFVAEIASLGRLRHRNLVRLLGYCRRKGELLLVYDYMPHGSLDKFLFTNEKPNLNWSQRLCILRGVASALLYLHEEWEQVVLHRDVKASNVLLDGDLNGRLGDFGLARLHERGSNPETTHLVGTVGYLAPEVSRIGKASASSDVFAFGAFLLEVACGRRPIEVQGLPEEMVLVDWVFVSWKRGAILETSDPRLEGDFPAEEMELVLKLGLLCSHTDPMLRPSMRQVVQYLDGNAILSDILIENSDQIDTIEMGNEDSVEFAATIAPSIQEGSSCSASSSESILRGR